MKCHKLVHHLGPGWKISTNTRWIAMIINMGTRKMRCYSQGVIPHVIALVTRMSHPELCWASQQAVEAAESTQCTESTDNACNHNMCIQTCIWTYDHVPTLNFAIKAETTGFIQGDVHQDVHKEGVRQGFPTANVWAPPVHPADIRTTDIKDFFVCALITVWLATYFRSRRHFS